MKDKQGNLIEYPDDHKKIQATILLECRIEGRNTYLKTNNNEYTIHRQPFERTYRYRLCLRHGELIEWFPSWSRVIAAIEHIEGYGRSM